MHKNKQQCQSSLFKSNHSKQHNKKIQTIPPSYMTGFTYIITRVKYILNEVNQCSDALTNLGCYQAFSITVCHSPASFALGLLFDVTRVTTLPFSCLVVVFF